MKTTHITGIDPGLVHTGLVSLAVYPVNKEIHVDHVAVAGIKPDQVRLFCEERMALPNHRFIEGYRPRSHMGTDKRMVEGVAEIKKATRGVVLNNTGIKKVVKRPLLELLGLWQFATPTHHDDLRSAARILVLGALKDEALNRLLTTVVKDHLRGETWDVRG